MPPLADKPDITTLMPASPRRELSLFDSICIIVGIIVATGIYRTSPDIAQQSPNVLWLIGLWLFGGLLSLIGRSATPNWPPRIRRKAAITSI